MKTCEVTLLLLIIAGAAVGDVASRQKIGASASKKSATSLRVKLPAERTSIIDNIVKVFQRQVHDRCKARVKTFGHGDLTVELAIRDGIGKEGFEIKDGPEGTIRIVGNDQRGLLYGIGKFLRTSRFDQGGFTPGSWRGISVPRKSIRGLYCATQWNIFYSQAPAEDVENYVEDLALWGFNNFMIPATPPRFHFKDSNDPKFKILLLRSRRLAQAARRIGMDMTMTKSVNQGFAGSPEKLRADTHTRRGVSHYEICPHKPGARELLLRYLKQEYELIADLKFDYCCLWPYDEGGCACQKCKPWGGNGFLLVAEDIAKTTRQYFPGVEIILSTWQFDAGDWIGMNRAFEKRPDWVNYLMVEPEYLFFHDEQLRKQIPGDLPVLGFPEISMYGMVPWGGFGANPMPKRSQRAWNWIKDHNQHGGFPYSEGIYEDINKAVYAQFYWEPDKLASETIREYIAFEFSPDVVEEVYKACENMESRQLRWENGKLSPKDTDSIWVYDRHIRWEDGILIDSDYKGTVPEPTPLKQDPLADKSYELLRQAQTKLSSYIRNSWRWRILYLRAMLDSELRKNEGRPTKECAEAFEELIEIYYAQNAAGMMKPPNPVVTPTGNEI